MWRRALLLICVSLFSVRSVAADDSASFQRAMIQGSVQFTDGKASRYALAPGASLIVRDSRQGFTYALFVTEDPAVGEVRMQSLLSGRGKAQDPSALDLEPLSNDRRYFDLYVNEVGLSITGTCQEEEGTDLSSRSSKFMGEICCVTCGARTICATAVTTSCGSCSLDFNF